jgi:leucine efflux protein
MSLYGVTGLWTYVIGAFGIILFPGPNSLYVLSVATARGVRAGYLGACGVFVGDTILLSLTALAAASLLRSNPAVFMVVKCCGAAYLSWVGLNQLWAAVGKWRGRAVVAPARETTANMQRPFHRALVISLLNPRAILFLLSFFVLFIDPNYATPAVPVLILSGIVMVFSALYLSALIFLGTRLAQAFRARNRVSASLSSAVGGLFLWFGTRLATASLN